MLTDEKYQYSNKQIKYNSNISSFTLNNCIPIHGAINVRCVQNHIIRMSYSSLIHGINCYECTSRYSKNQTRKMLTKIKEAGNKLGLTLLSNNYNLFIDKLEWECKSGHICFIKYNKVQWGHGCKECSINYRRSSTNKIRIEASKIGFKLVSGKCRSNQLELRCVLNGHTTFMSYTKMKKSFGCTKCCSSKGQTLIRNILTEMKIPFEEEVQSIPSHPKYKFDFVCFVNGEYVFIEYDGIQHFEIECFSRSDEEFIKARERDIFKQNCVISNNHRMIRIDYTIEDDDIKDHLLTGFNTSDKIYYSTPELYEWM